MVSERMNRISVNVCPLGACPRGVPERVLAKTVPKMPPWGRREAGPTTRLEGWVETHVAGGEVDFRDEKARSPHSLVEEGPKDSKH